MLGAVMTIQLGDDSGLDLSGCRAMFRMWSWDDLVSTGMGMLVGTRS